MATKPPKNVYFNGNKGEVWINGILVFTAYKASIIKKNKYEEFPSPTGNGTTRVLVGYSIEVTMTYKNTGIEDLKAFNESDDVSVIMSETNINGDVTRRVKADGVTFDDETLIQFEKNKVGEIELSGQAETYEILQDK